ncbi:MAG: hypothetical protein CR975_06100 [Gammaproteobacteria bacterium]|nr:MAG: hypothetical protein CR975_06100 [Gammaproteobacteria bacterium]
MTDTPFNQAYQRCLQLLARREYSQLELRQKLTQQSVEAAVIDDCLARLQQENYQSDRRFADMLCHTRVNQRYGSQKIRYELKQKGIENSLINATLAEYQTMWLDNARQLISRKASGAEVKKIFTDFTLKHKITRFLVGKGYDYDTIHLAFESLQDDDK